jgi:hypothetical protein
MKTRLLLVGLALSAILVSPVLAEEGKVKGYMFGDYYYVATADDAETKYPEKQNAFRFRRIYFTYEKEIAEGFSTRYRLEVKDAGYGKGSKMTPFVKHAYLKWGGVVAGSDLYFGLVGTPTWAVSEKVWGYRSIEATVMDVNKFGSSADIGAAIKGKSGKLGYYSMVGNGPGQSAENDNGKKLYGSVSFQATDAVQVEGYADYNMLPGDQNEMTVKGFAGLQKEKLSAGLEAFVRIHQKAVGGEDETITGISAFGSLELAEKLKGFGRVDMLSYDVAAATDLLLIAGLDHMPAKNVHLMPNIYIEMPDGPDPTIQGRLTVYYKF